jgi:hypothetical protein
MSDTAKQVGVDRSTIYRWLHEDEIFVAKLNQAKQEHIQAVRGELSRLAYDATRVVSEFLLSPDAPWPIKLKTALTILNAFGALVPEKIGSTDPDEIRSEQSTRRILSFI